MTMNNERTIQVLNGLLEAEYSTLSQHLGECSPFLSMQTAEDAALLQRIHAEARRNQREVTDLIIRLRGAPLPPRLPTELGGVAYLTLEYLMPQIIAGLRSLIRKYESSSGTGTAEADALVSRIVARYRSQLRDLEKRHLDLAATAR